MSDRRLVLLPLSQLTACQLCTVLGSVDIPNTVQLWSSSSSPYYIDVSLVLAQTFLSSLFYRLDNPIMSPPLRYS